MNSKPKQNNSSAHLMRYASLGGQIFIALGIAVFAGYKIDQWLNPPIPLAVWLFPLLILCVLIYKLIKDTSKHNSTNAK